MKTHDVRIWRLRRLAEQFGSYAELARRADLDPAQLSRLIGSHPTKRVGCRLARRIEATLQLDNGHLDLPPTESDLSGKLAAISAQQQTLIGKLLDRPIDDASAQALSTLVDRL